MTRVTIEGGPRSVSSSDCRRPAAAREPCGQGLRWPEYVPDQEQRARQAFVRAILEHMSEPWRPPGDLNGLPSCVRQVNPPLWVWVNTRKLFTKGPHDDYSSDPAGLELDHEVPGLLIERIWRADGGWLGRVQIELQTRDQQWALGPWTALVPEHLLRYQHTPGVTSRRAAGPRRVPCGRGRRSIGGILGGYP